MNSLKEVESWLRGIVTELPGCSDSDVFISVAAVTFFNEKKLVECTVDSIVGSLKSCAYRGLLPDGKEAMISPKGINIGTRQRPVWEQRATFSPMVDGVLKMARLSPDVLSIASHPVFKEDDFDYWVDDAGEHFKHAPNLGKRGPMIGVYAFARLANSELLFEYMTRDDINKTRLASKMPNKGPWKEWPDRMACKGCLHRLARRLPNADEVVELAEIGSPMKWHKGPEEIPVEDIPVESKFYDQVEFENNYPSWESLISSNKKTKEHLINNLQKRVKLTEVQIAAINNIEVNQTGESNDEAS